MAEHVVDFLKMKFSKSPCPKLLMEISKKLEETKTFKRENTLKIIDNLYQLNFLFDECVMSEDKTATTTTTYSGISKHLGSKIRFSFTKLLSSRTIPAQLQKLKGELFPLLETPAPADEAQTPSISIIKREGFPYFDKSEVCGFDGPLGYFKEYIIEKKQRNVAMAFVGIGGSGKSTMARMIFLDEEVQKKFDGVVLWLDCSEVFDAVKQLPCVTVEKFRHNTSPCRYTLEEALRLLHDIIRDRRCLVVLDGAWISDGIKTFMDVVTGQLNGTVIITTRVNIVAEKLVEKENIVFAENFCTLLSDDEMKKKEEKKKAEEEEEKKKKSEEKQKNKKAEEEEKKKEAEAEETKVEDAEKLAKEGVDIHSVKNEKEQMKEEYCLSVFEKTLRRKKFGNSNGTTLDEDVCIVELKDAIKRGSLGNPLAAKTLAEVVSQKLYETGYWAQEETIDQTIDRIVDKWEFLLKVDVFDHLSLSKVWYKVLSTKGVVKNRSYFHKNELLITSNCPPRDVLRALRSVCHVEFISISKTKTTSNKKS